MSEFSDLKKSMEAMERHMQQLESRIEETNGRTGLILKLIRGPEIPDPDKVEGLMPMVRTIWSGAYGDGKKKGWDGKVDLLMENRSQVIAGWAVLSLVGIVLGWIVANWLHR